MPSRRLRWSVALAALIEAGGLLCLQALPAAAAGSASDWPGYGGRPAHTGLSSAEDTLSPTTAGSYRPAWISTPIPGSDHVSQPVVWNDTVIAGRAGTIRAFDAATGAVRWSAGGSVRGLAPSVQGGAVFVLRDSRVVGLDVADGHEVWRSAARPRITSTQGPSITAAQNVVLVAGQGITAFSRTSGAVVWRFRDDESWSSPSVRGGVAISVQSGVNVVALDLRTGHRLWTATSDGASSTLDGFPAAFGLHQVVVPSAYDSLASFDPTTGRELWRGVPGHESIGYAVRQLAFNGATAYFIDRVQRETYDALTAVRARDGHPRWSFTVGPDFGDHAQPLGVTLANGVVMFTVPPADDMSSEPTHLVLLEAASGHLLLNLPVPSGGDRPPSISQGRIFVGTGDRLMAFSPDGA